MGYRLIPTKIPEKSHKSPTKSSGLKTSFSREKQFLPKVTRNGHFGQKVIFIKSGYLDQKMILRKNFFRTFFGFEKTGFRKLDFETGFRKLDFENSISKLDFENSILKNSISKITRRAILGEKTPSHNSTIQNIAK